jgi:hypothetical protein
MGLARDAPATGIPGHPASAPAQMGLGRCGRARQRGIPGHHGPDGHCRAPEHRHENTFPGRYREGAGQDRGHEYGASTGTPGPYSPSLPWPPPGGLGRLPIARYCTTLDCPQPPAPPGCIMPVPARRRPCMSASRRAVIGRSSYPPRTAKAFHDRAVDSPPVAGEAGPEVRPDSGDGPPLRDGEGDARRPYPGLVDPLSEEVGCWRHDDPFRLA